MAAMGHWWSDVECIGMIEAMWSPGEVAVTLMVLFLLQDIIFNPQTATIWVEFLSVPDM